MEFVVALRGLGVLAKVDLFDRHDPSVNWANYGSQAIRESDYVIIATSRAYKERWEGTNAPTEGAGVAREANVLKGLFETDQRAFYRKVKVAILPGESKENIPEELRASLQHFVIDSMTQSGLEDLYSTLAEKSGASVPAVGEASPVPESLIGIIADDGRSAPSSGLEDLLAALEERLSMLEGKLNEGAKSESSSTANLIAERSTVEVALNLVNSAGEPRSSQNEEPGKSFWTQFVIPVVVIVVGGLLLALVTGLLKGDKATATSFFARVDGGVEEPGGAGVFTSARKTGVALDRIAAGHGEYFTGFCIGETIESVSTHTSDQIWFILPGGRLMSAAMMDGNAPAGTQPTQCNGGISGPSAVALSVGARNGKLILHADAPGAALVGFAVRDTQQSHWQGLPLAQARKGQASDEGILTKRFVAIAVACWARGVPAHPENAQEYVQQMRWPRNTADELRSAATNTTTEGIGVACSPTKRKPPRPSKSKKHKKRPKRKSVAPVTPGNGPTVRIETEPALRPGSAGNESTKTETTKTETSTTAVKPKSPVITKIHIPIPNPK